MSIESKDSLQATKKQALWIAYLGWLVTLAVMIILKGLGYSDILASQLIIFFSAATASHIICYLIIHYHLDRFIPFDPHFVLFPNWFFFAPIAAYGYYALGSARDIMLVGWLMGLFFLAGYVRFLGIFITSVWYMTLYLGILLWFQSLGKIHVDFIREMIRSLILLTVCGFYAWLLDRFAAQRQHLTNSIKALREKDQEITRLNKKLARFVTSPLVEHLAHEKDDTILAHQRRKVTIFFSDITSFSTMTDALEPEELAQLLNEYFSEMITIVAKFDGTLDKLMGDGIMVLFGAPKPIDPGVGAWRCIQMAVTMQQRLEVLNQQWWDRGIPFRLQVRMGINTGLSIVGSFGTKAWLNYTAIGGQVNIAARLQQMAEPGQILFSHSTYALVSHHVKAKLLGEMKLKGTHYPIHVYRFQELISPVSISIIQDQGHGYYLSICPQLLENDVKERLLNLLRDHLQEGAKDGDNND